MQLPPDQKPRSWKVGLLKSFRCAARGLIELATRERNTRIHLVFAAAAIGLCWWLNVSALEWCAVLLAIGLVMVAEGLNTAIEMLADAVSMEPREDFRKLKDIAAGAVLTGAIVAAAVGAIIFLPKLWIRLGP